MLEYKHNCTREKLAQVPSLLTNTTLDQQLEQVLDNRQHLVDFCKVSNAKIMNTFFQKPEHKNNTFKQASDHIGPPWIRGTYECLDTCIIHNRWKNSITDAESHVYTNTPSDHYPSKC
jgi:hypothetical protein